MLIECLIKREGPTPVELGKTRYMFMPVPDPNRARGEATTSICEINASEHLEFLLKSPQFRPYEAGQPAPEEELVVNLSGYAIVKHTEGRTEGYRVEDTLRKPKRYAGSDGTWREEIGRVVPFGSEFEAWQWLREEVETNPDIGMENLTAAGGRKGRKPKLGEAT